MIFRTSPPEIKDTVDVLLTTTTTPRPLPRPTYNPPWWHPTISPQELEKVSPTTIFNLQVFFKTQDIKTLSQLLTQIFIVQEEERINEEPIEEIDEDHGYLILEETLTQITYLMDQGDLNEEGALAVLLRTPIMRATIAGDIIENPLEKFEAVIMLQYFLFLKMLKYYYL